MKKQTENNQTGGFDMLNDQELGNVAGGKGDSGKERIDKALDMVDKVLDCAGNDSPVVKAGVSGMKSVIKTIKGK